MRVENEQAQGSIPDGASLEVPTILEGAPVETQTVMLRAVGPRTDSFVRASFIWPALLVVLTLSIFPLIVSLYLSFSNLQFVSGGFIVPFVGLEHYRDLLFGSGKSELLGVMRPPSLLGWIVFGAGVALFAWMWIGALRSDKISVVGLVLRGLGALLAILLLWIVVQVFAPSGRPGSLIVTLTYVFVGIAFQYGIGLGLAYLVTQRLPGRRFFRVVFLLPMMITPVGVAYMFRMLMDTQKGPFHPIFVWLNMSNFTWVRDPWGARIAVMIGDIWQWTPFMFIVLLAALEHQDMETVEASLVDGASRWQTFRYITWPAIIPVTTTLILIRMIEAFKIVDLPNILTNGGPGTATESLTLQAYISWRTFDLGTSAALAYILLFLVTIFGVAYVNLIRRRVTES